jgi:iron(III) transport system ATP-binding protein
MSFLLVDQVFKVEQGREIVKPVSFTLEKLQRIAIAGETGSGKSTLLKMIAGLLQPDGGKVYFEEEIVRGPLERLLPGHPKIAYLSQHFELRNNYRIEELMEMVNKLPVEEAEKIYRVCQVEHLLKRRTDELSGGEKQRIALARLLTTSPQLLLLDEPFSNLDRIHKETIKSVIEEIGNQLNITCVMVSHDAADTLSWAEHIMIMQDGAVVQQGKPQQLYFSPNSEYVASLMGEYNLIDSSANPVFKKLLGDAAIGRRALLRPEQFILGGMNSNSVEGVVEQVKFYGTHYIVTVRVDGFLVKVRTYSYAQKQGERVWLGLA